LKHIIFLNQFSSFESSYQIEMRLFLMRLFLNAIDRERERIYVYDVSCKRFVNVNDNLVLLSDFFN